MTHHLPPLSYSGVTWLLERKNALTRNKKGEHAFVRYRNLMGSKNKKTIIEALLSNAVSTSGWMTGQVELGMIF